MTEQSLKAEKGTASEVGAATAMTTAEESLKDLQDTNIRLCKLVEEHDSTLTEMLDKIKWLDSAIRKSIGWLEILDSRRSKSKEKLEKAKRKVTSGVSEGEISKRKTTKGQNAMKTPLPRLGLNQQASASKAVKRMSGGLKI